MRRVAVAVLLVVLVTSARDTQALRLGAERIIIPVIGRFAGAGGTQWRTDVFLSNPFSPTVPVTLRFYPSGGAMQSRVISLPPFSTVVLTDVVLTTFGLSNAGGMLEVDAGALTTEARARIYNTGNPAGQFGQSVPGVGFFFLTRQALMYGLSGINGNRLNIGVTNPNDVAVPVSITIRDKDGVTLHSREVTVAAHGNIQYNDIFSNFGIAPREGVTVSFGTAEPRIYGYASEVRNDTGDAIFVLGLSPNS